MVGAFLAWWRRRYAAWRDCCRRCPTIFGPHFSAVLHQPGCHKFIDYRV